MSEDVYESLALYGSEGNRVCGTVSDKRLLVPEGSTKALDGKTSSRRLRTGLDQPESGKLETGSLSTYDWMISSCALTLKEHEALRLGTGGVFRRGLGGNGLLILLAMELLLRETDGFLE